MTLYRVIWEIDIEADSYRQAAEDALEIQRNPSDAVVFEVIDGETLVGMTIDLAVDEADDCEAI